MPLPFAPPPKDSSIYQQLESTTLSTLTTTQLDTLRAKIFSQGTEGNEDEYRRLLLLFLAANQLSTSGPIPGTVDVINFQSTSSGSAVGIIEDGFYKDEGGMYQLFAPSISVSGISGSVQHELRLVNDGATLEILDFSTTGGSLRPTTEDGFIGIPYVSFPAYLTYEASGTFTQSNMALGIVRVR